MESVNGRFDREAEADMFGGLCGLHMVINWIIIKCAFFTFCKKQNQALNVFFSFSTRKTKDAEKKGIYYEYVFMYSV